MNYASLIFLLITLFESCYLQSYNPSYGPTLKLGGNSQPIDPIAYEKNAQVIRFDDITLDFGGNSNSFPSNNVQNKAGNKPKKHGPSDGPELGKFYDPINVPAFYDPSSGQGYRCFDTETGLFIGSPEYQQYLAVAPIIEKLNIPLGCYRDSDKKLILKILDDPNIKEQLARIKQIQSTRKENILYLQDRPLDSKDFFRPNGSYRLIDYDQELNAFTWPANINLPQNIEVRHTLNLLLLNKLTDSNCDYVKSVFSILSATDRSIFKDNYITLASSLSQAAELNIDDINAINFSNFVFKNEIQELKSTHKEVLNFTNGALDKLINKQDQKEFYLNEIKVAAIANSFNQDDKAPEEALRLISVYKNFENNLFNGVASDREKEFIGLVDFAANEITVNKLSNEEFATQFFKSGISIAGINLANAHNNLCRLSKQQANIVKNFCKLGQCFANISKSTIKIIGNEIWNKHLYSILEICKGAPEGIFDGLASTIHGLNPIELKNSIGHLVEGGKALTNLLIDLQIDGWDEKYGLLEKTEMLCKHIESSSIQDFSKVICSTATNIIAPEFAIKNIHKLASTARQQIERFKTILKTLNHAERIGELIETAPGNLVLFADNPAAIVFNQAADELGKMGNAKKLIANYNEAHFEYLEKLNLNPLKNKDHFDKIHPERWKKFNSGATPYLIDDVNECTELLDKVKLSNKMFNENKITIKPHGPVTDPIVMKIDPYHSLLFEVETSENAGRVKTIKGGHLDYKNLIQKNGLRDPSKMKITLTGKEFMGYYESQLDFLGKNIPQKAHFPSYFNPIDCTKVVIEAAENISPKDSKIQKFSGNIHLIGKTKKGEFINFIVKPDGKTTFWPNIDKMIEEATKIKT